MEEPLLHFLLFVAAGFFAQMIDGTLVFFVTLAASATLLLTIGVTNWLPILGLHRRRRRRTHRRAVHGQDSGEALMIADGVVVILLSLRTIAVAVAVR